MSMENVGNSMSKDFEGFLFERMGEVISEDIITEIGLVIEKILTDAGLPMKNEDMILSKICEHQEIVYHQGVKDGFHLALHLLGMAPENRKEA
jgi:hypothetical protein